jgi:alcohol dehydrogenase class IV
MLHAPHGAICAKLLPLVMEANLKAMNSREPNHPAIARYDEVAEILTGNKNAAAFDGVQWVSDLVRDLNIPMLSVYGMTSARFSEAVDKTMKASSTKGNPIVLTEVEFREIMQKAL